MPNESARNSGDRPFSRRRDRRRVLVHAVAPNEMRRYTSEGSMVCAAHRVVFAVAILAIASVSLGCSSAGHYVWFTQLPPNFFANQAEYVIGPADSVSIRVLGHDEMNVKERVRPDGRIAIPLVGEVEARGKRTTALRAELEARLKDYIVLPSVMLSVDDPQPMTILLMGEITRPGVYPIEASGSLGQALALGGGLTDFASRDSIFVVRQQPDPIRIRFTYEAVSRNEGRATGFPLHPGDLIVVE